MTIMLSNVFHPKTIVLFVPVISEASQNFKHLTEGIIHYVGFVPSSQPLNKLMNKAMQMTLIECQLWWR